MVVVVGGLHYFSVSFSPLGTNWGLKLIGTWLGFGDLSALEQGLTIQSFFLRSRANCEWFFNVGLTLSSCHLK